MRAIVKTLVESILPALDRVVCLVGDLQVYVSVVSYSSSPGPSEALIAASTLFKLCETIRVKASEEQAAAFEFTKWLKYGESSHKRR